MPDELAQQGAGQAADDVPSPSFEEMEAYHAIIGGPLFRLSPSASSGQRTAALCTVSNRRLHGSSLNVYELLGADMYDYPPVHVGTKADLDALLSAMRHEAAREGADAVRLSPLLLPDGMPPPAGATPLETFLFDSALSPKGWGEITSKGTPRKARNRVRNAYDYEVARKRGDEITREDIEDLARLHIERWAMDDVASPFLEERRIREFMCHLENKTLTTVRVNGDVLAMAYGMAFGATLLWHTVAVNVLYLDTSPMRIIVLELAEMARDMGFTKLDFGMGDESYKDQFANTRRSCWEVFMPISTRAKLLQKVWNTVPPERVKAAALAARRRAGEMKFRLENARAELLCFEITGGGSRPETDLHLAVPDTFAEFVSLARSLNLPIERLHHDRYRAASRIAILHDGRQRLSQGWITREEPFEITEVDRRVSLGDATMLYHFETPEEHRRRGYYTVLLRLLIAGLPGERLWISAMSNNPASFKAIRKAGFQPCPLWPEAPVPGAYEQEAP